MILHGRRSTFGAVCVLLGMLLGRTAMAVPADAGVAVKADVSAPSFKPDTDSDAHRIIVAAAFLLLLGMGAVGTVYYARRGGLMRLKLAVDASPMRVISARRVTSRLTLVKVRIDDRRTVVIADNGSHLLLVADDVHEAPPRSPDA